MNEGGDQDLTNLDGIATVMNIIDNEAPEKLKAQNEFAEVEVLNEHNMVTVNTVKKYNR